ncbi:MAG TPA: ABC transporter permease, partial [Chryseolinea sp.]|nr:ABC transporter permease [Chryseolinea sp.]
RNLVRHRFFSFINIFGLAVAMTLSMVIIMLVADQMMYDRHNTKRDRIYRINSIPHGSDGGAMNETATTSLPLREEILDTYTGVEKSARIVRGFGNMWLEIEQDVNIPIVGFYADPEMLDIFELELEYGNPKTALVEPYSVVLTHKAAKKLFKQENPVGETFKVGDEGPYKVTGILKDSDQKSHIIFDALASLSTVTSLEAQDKRTKGGLDNWYNAWQGWIYILLEEGKTIDDIKPQLAKTEQKHYSTLPNPDTDHKIEYRLQALMGITPGPFINNPIGPFLPWIFVYFFAGLAGVVMLTSCFNFTNLSIARSLTRAREIGVRKVTGAMRWQVFVQFLSESVLIALIALVAAVGFLIAMKPFMMKLSFARMMKWDLEGNYFVFIVFLVFAIVVGILAGFFPAVVLSRFQPIKVLKGLGTMKLFSNIGMRKTLLVTQFTFSLIFILSVVVVFNQLQLFLRADHGFSMEHKVVVNLGTTSAEALKNELLKYNNIESVSAASHVPAAGSSYGEGYKKSLEDKEWTSLNYFSTDEDYLRNLTITLVAGKYFDVNDGESNKNFIVLNEKAVNAFHYGSPLEAIGQEIILKEDSSRKQIIGVVKDYNHQMLFQDLEPMALIYNPKEYRILQVAYTGNFDEAGKSIEAAWAKTNPALQVDYKDFYGEVHKIYDIFFGDLVSILSVISVLAITISCLGLLGMATYATETRIKEISIRKVLGSTNSSLIYLLSKGFVVILIIAIVIAVPAAYFINNLWLEKLAYHVEVDLKTIAIGVVMLIVFGTLTIGSQTWRATYIKPVDNLKND